MIAGRETTARIDAIMGAIRPAAHNGTGLPNQIVEQTA
jgi:hypothetical protein